MMRFASGLLLGLLAGPTLAQEPDALTTCLPDFGAAAAEVSACVGVFEQRCLGARATIEEDAQTARTICLIGERDSWGAQILELADAVETAAEAAARRGAITAARAAALRENVAGWRSTDWMNAREEKCYREVEPYDSIAEQGCMMEETVKRYLYLNGMLRQLSGKAPLVLEGVSE